MTQGRKKEEVMTINQHKIHTAYSRLTKKAACRGWIPGSHRLTNALLKQITFFESAFGIENNLG